MSHAFSDFFGKKLALLIWYRNEKGDNTAGIVSGTAFLHDGHLAIHRGSLLPPLPIPLAMVWKAVAVPGHLKDILKSADFCIQGSVNDFGLIKPRHEEWLSA